MSARRSQQSGDEFSGGRLSKALSFHAEWARKDYEGGGEDDRGGGRHGIRKAQAAGQRLMRDNKAKAKKGKKGK